MFVPQVITAVTAALLGAGLLRPGLARRLGERAIYLALLVLFVISLRLPLWPGPGDFMSWRTS
jgi:Na+/melibiose symporter-like transporter